MSQRIPTLYVAYSDLHGRGVFSGAPIPEGSMIEICPVLELSEEELVKIKETQLYDYYFEWGSDLKDAAIALGFGSIYNHSVKPNAKYLVDFENKSIEIHCIKDIEPGEEILINYNGSPENKDQVWFEKEGQVRSKMGSR